jgi:hypothetical protein
MKDHRIVICVGYTSALIALGGCGDLFRAGPGGECVEPLGLGNVPVLAKAAGKVAARRAEGQNRASRKEVIERLLLDWINAKA